MTEIAFREAQMSDLDALVGLWVELEEAQSRHRRFHLAPDARTRIRAAFADAIASTDGCVLLGRDGVRVVAMAHCKVVPATKLGDSLAVELGRVVVARSERGAGLGRALIAAAERWGRERGAVALRAGVFAGNQAAFGFWRSIGFEDFVMILARPIDGVDRSSPGGHQDQVGREADE